MNTAPIDRNILNGLFDNQKKLDELFDSIFDDDNFISSPSSSSQSASYYPTFDVDSQLSYSDGNVNGSSLSIKRNSYYYVLTVALEIAAIYLVVKNLL